MARSRISRRRLLDRVLPGAAAVAWGCRSGQGRGTVERTFVGQSPDRGHLLRTGELREADIAQRVRCAVVIVGGGVAGMAAAWRLRRAGVTDVHLIELEAAAGGTARSATLPRSRCPLGAHYLPTPHPDFHALHTLLEDLDIITGRTSEGRPEYAPSAVCGAPVERHFESGMWHEGIYPARGQTSDESEQWDRWLAHLSDLDGRRGSDGRRLFDLPVERSSVDLRGLDRLSMADYIDRLGITSWRARWTIDYACRDDYGCTLAQTSAFAGLHHFLARGLEQSRSGFLLAWPEGNDHLVQGMAQRAELGDRLHPDSMVYAVDPGSHVLVHDFGTGKNIAYEADAILWAAPRFVLTALVPPGTDSLERGALSYVPWLVANVQVGKRPAGVGAPLGWDNVPVGRDNLGYVLATHTEPMTSSQTEAVLTYYEPLCADTPDQLRARRAALLAGTLDHFSEHVLGELEHMHPGIRTDVTHVQIARWGHGMVRPTPNLLFGGALARARASIGRVVPCATDTGGLPLFEQAFSGGVGAAEQACARIGKDVRTIL